ncbi:histidine phosphatase family protein [Lactobacillus pentosus]|jgi:probable phosphoglycerate mutase|uniref:histidine phosphatase family protein n=1 Tax=Lactiplantibacillus pentosus TaxID=1589 RepID=UPI00128D6EDD|nr:histidine phosphatase family protein [Lactiplantibacillus pentosus]BBM21539.1 phosphoglycerate mutase family protein [Lactiplantibacillus plantarum]MCT3288100.1 histidine phosphatase family protein [Lactiplantibacillus pentosus]MCT3292441.1 histidine phosphatase family protein [Lactiplantibacillus pentosus]MPQ17847.1 histidine phosphatase family protein [Lactiplantibacillus pentosus]UXI97542.1 histidine phosphatase family protein [Lactiplantibacillus pentosus]
MTTFYVVRHGQTTANAQNLKQGTINTDITHLNSVGQQQAQTLHDAFDISFADRLICSPLDRTQATAAILNAGRDLPVSTDERLLEISYGQWDGQANDQLLAAYPQYFDPMLQDVLPSYVDVATDGETFTHVQQRVQAFLTAMAQAYPDEQLIVVTHGFTVKAMALAVLQPKDPMSLPEPANTSVTKIVVDAVHARQYLAYYNRLPQF